MRTGKTSRVSRSACSDARPTSKRFSTWLYRVTVNVVLMHRRAAKSRPVFSEVPEGLSAIDQRPFADEQLERQRRVSAFHRLLDQLSDKKRELMSNVLNSEGAPLKGLTKADIDELFSD